jgi:predicted phosphodiesterase
LWHYREQKRSCGQRDKHPERRAAFNYKTKGPPMRLALISDIHGNLPALEAVVADIRHRGADQIVCLGDNLSGPLLPKETAQYLIASGWIVLAGNHERQVLSYQSGEGGASDAYAHSQLSEFEFAWLRSLQPHLELSPEVFLCHGTPRSDCEHFLETVRGDSLIAASDDEIADRLGDVKAAVVACGHSHVPRSMRSASGQLLVNPGSVGLQAYIDDHPRPYSMQSGTPDARYAIVEKRAGQWTCGHFAVPYNARPMAKLARLRHQPNWEQALLRGYIGS